MLAPSATPLSTSGWSRKGPAAAVRRLPCTLGEYVLLEHVGRGGMADIYLAEQRFTLGASRRVAVKEIIPELRGSARFGQMLAAEARLVARLRHPNVVGVEGLGSHRGSPFMVMEYVDGLDLRELLRRATDRRIAMPLSVSVTVLCDVLRALDHAHRAVDDGGVELFVVHRDVSPSNVLLSFDGEVKLCDFGIAASTEGVPPESIEGKAGYMSPEHARGEPVDARSDVFAVGIMLWELVSGRRMYRAKKGLALLAQARRAERPEMGPRGLPEEERLHAILERALAVDPRERYPSARVMLRELEAYAIDTRLYVSPVRLGAWLRSTFQADVVERRAEKARQAALGAAVAEPPPSQPSLFETPQSGEVVRGEEEPLSPFAGLVNDIDLSPRDDVAKFTQTASTVVRSEVDAAGATEALEATLGLATVRAATPSQAPPDATSQLDAPFDGLDDTVAAPARAFAEELDDTVAVASAEELDDTVGAPSGVLGVRPSDEDSWCADALALPPIDDRTLLPNDTVRPPPPVIAAHAASAAEAEAVPPVATAAAHPGSEPEGAPHRRPRAARKRSPSRAPTSPGKSRTPAGARRARARSLAERTRKTRAPAEPSRVLAAPRAPASRMQWRALLGWALATGVVSFVLLWWLSHL